MRCRIVSCLLLSLTACSSQPTQDVALADATDRSLEAGIDVYSRPDAPAPQPTMPYVPHEPRLRRLTQRQYTNSIRDVFGEGLVVTRSLEPDVRSDGSTSIGATNSTISQRGTEQYEESAYDIAQQVLRSPERRAMVLSCTPTAVRDDACASAFLRVYGRRLWRRPLAESELSLLVDLSGRAAEALMDFYRGLEFGLAALLQSPDFLFRAEMGTVREAERRYERYELASRLAYFLWNGPPDDALLDAAERGELEHAETLSAQVDRMLASPKARRGLEAFVSDWLRLDDLDFIARDATLYPSFGADFAPSAREEVLRTVSWIVFDRDADFREVLTTRETFVNRRLASIYGIPFPVRGAPVTQFERVQFPESQPRRGILGMAAFLGLEAHPTSTSPTLRGKYVREVLLCQTMPPPPAGVNTAIPEPSATARTLRDRLLLHQEVASCRGCHQLMDTVGLGFEHFDALGRFRAVENGVLIDASGTLDFIPFRDAAELAQILYDEPKFTRCVVHRLYRHAWGAHEAEPQREEIERLWLSFSSSGFKLKALLRTIALGEAFRRASMLDVAPLPSQTDAGAGDAATDASDDASVEADR
jgi:hypothetical protein